MITIEELKNKGADVETGLSRCVGNETLYLKLIKMGLEDVKFDELGTTLEAKNLDKAFELCHALKGVIGNLALTPLYDAVSQMTGREQADYPTMYSDILKLRSNFLGN